MGHTEMLSLEQQQVADLVHRTLTGGIITHRRWSIRLHGICGQGYRDVFGTDTLPVRYGKPVLVATTDDDRPGAYWAWLVDIGRLPLEQRRMLILRLALMHRRRPGEQERIVRREGGVPLPAARFMELVEDEPLVTQTGGAER